MPFPWELNSDRPYRHQTYPPRIPSFESEIDFNSEHCDSCPAEPQVAK